MRDNRRYYLHQRIKNLADYNAIRKEVSVPNDATEVMKNKYVIELRDKFGYNIQLTIPAGPEYLIQVIETLIEKRDKAKKELRSIQKAIDVIQNSCEHKMNDGTSAWKVIAHTHKEISQCQICKKEVTA
jgi:acetone carboxylase gamma subunit